MDIREKLKAKRRKKKSLVALTSIALITTTLATMKLTGFSMPLNKNTLKVSEKDKVTSITIADDGAIVCDSIVQGVRDCNLADGNYIFRVVGSTDGGTTTESKDYAIELINYTEDVHYELGSGETATTVSLGDTSTDYKMLVVKYHKNLTIDAGVTVTATNVSNLTYKKGMYICVLGDLVNNGTISMTARGTYNCAGENVYLWKNIDNTYEYVPAVGGVGGAAVTTRSGGNYWTSKSGTSGNSGISRQTGGGGAGASANYGATGTSGAGGSGTSYSGGAGGGGECSGKVSITASSGSSTGGAGGQGYCRRISSGHSMKNAGGGAGNLGGNGWYTSGSNLTGYAVSDSSKGENGTGGLLTIYADSLNNMGQITSQGSNGGKTSSNDHNTPGGSSGGGSINIFVNSILNKGVANTNGGIAVACTDWAGTITGGSGGIGSETTVQLYPDLIYNEKTITLGVGDTYIINTSNLKYINQNIIQTGIINLGDLNYQVLDTSVASIDNNGRILAKSEGKTKIKITDITNGISTYVFLNVKNGIKASVQEGDSFTIALKENGTVWSYGLNDKGQLGTGDNDNSSKPVKIIELSNIKEIAAGYSHGLALNERGEVYAWGKGINGQLGDGNQNDSNIPVKVAGLTDIIKIDAYKNISIAIDKYGKVYTWGEGYSTIPMKLIFSEKVVDISGTLILTENGVVYDISDITTAISDLKNIAKIACGTNHYLALSTYGILYSWGINTYGECGVTETGNLEVNTIAENVFDISAGNMTSIFQKENNKVYVLGNNENGQIGLEADSNTTFPTEIILNENIDIENISAGEWTHSALIDINGYVWHTGINDNGELGIKNNENVNIYTKTGDKEIKLNVEDTIYLDIGENETIIPILENAFNLKKDLIDDNQDNFTITLSSSEKLNLNNKTISALDYGKTIITITHNVTGIIKEIENITIRKMDSIVQGIKDTNLVDGEYEILVQDKIYKIELINYYDDVTYTEDVSLGDDTTDYKMLVVKYHGDLTINKGVTVTATTVNNLTYKKGMYLCVLGNIYNNGTISMTARGTYNLEGENVYLWKNIDNSYEYVPAVGGTGASTRSINGLGTSIVSNGEKGEDGVNRATGGGGSGGIRSWRSYIKNAAGGSNGTSYSGGSGGGGVYRWSNSNTTYSDTYFAESNAKENGGAGGTGFAYQTEHNNAYANGGGGGAGNPIGTNATTGTRGTMYTNINAENGTGGLLLIYTEKLLNEGIIESNGSNGGIVRGNGGCSASGGSSGGGSINIFANFVTEYGIISKTGGSATSENTVANTKGGAGGNGSVTITQLGSILNYNPKSINMLENETYQIDTSKISLIKLNTIQTEDLTLGTLSYESLDDSIATVDTNGKITAIKNGKTKIKITDETNKLSTYIIVEIRDNGTVTPQIKEGANHTVALKNNGTVWAYGKNDNGQLGNNTTIASNEAVQVLNEMQKPLKNIIDIGADENSSIAVDSDGNVYTWGKYTYLEEQTTTDETTGLDVTNDVTVNKNQIVATKVSGLSNIVKVDTYKNKNYAVSKEGKVYVWGDGYKEITLIDTGNIVITDVAGELLLEENGFVYKIDNLNEPIELINSTYNISSYNGTYAFVTLDGHAYTLGKGTNGNLGNGNIEDVKYRTLVKTQDGYLENVYNISIKNGQGMATTFDGKAYVWGDNTNNKIAQTGLNSKANYLTYATQIITVQDKEGNEITLPNMEIAEAGFNKSSLMDEEGYAYSVGQNINGELGTGDNVDRAIFTKIGNTKIVADPESITIEKGETISLSIIASNTFNLKRDVIGEEEPNIINTNEKISSIEKIEAVDNSNIKNFEDFTPNYKLTGNTIGKNDIAIKMSTGEINNIWVNVVNKASAGQEKSISPAKVSNGNKFTIALRSNGEVYSFGENKNGQLGLGDSIDRNEPIKIDINEEIMDISTGTAHTLILTKEGTVYSFGQNGKGQLGQGNTSTYNIPMQIVGLTNITKVSVNQNTSFAINKDGNAYAWGENYTKVPSKINIDANIVDISKNYYLSDDGIVRLLKDNSEIKLSLNEYDPAADPVYIEERIVEISEGTDHLLMLGESGQIYTVGKNVYGQLGDGTTIERTNISTVVRVKGGNTLKNIVEVSAGDKYSTVVSKDGKVYTWGINSVGQLGFNQDVSDEGIQESGYAIVNNTISNIERISSGYVHTSVYKDDGKVYTYGQGEEGELGNGANLNSYEVQLVGKNMVQANSYDILLEEGETYNVQAHINKFNLFIDEASNITYQVLDTGIAMIGSSTGELMALGAGRTTIIIEDNESGKIAVINLRILEKGTTPNGATIKIEPQVKTAGSHTVMLKVDGTVWCYGIGNYGELGNGKQEISDEPVQAIFPDGTKIVQIAAGEEHSIALDSEGNVWTWGRNQYYQLGNNKDEFLLNPTKVESLKNIRKIGCGNYTSFAINEDGELFSFGLNANGEGGIGSFTNKVVPTKAKNTIDVIDVKGGKNHTIILKSDGTVYVTGSNLYGELGQDDTSIKKTSTFVKVDIPTTVRIGCGDGNNTVVLLDGSVYAWGENIYRELGILNSNISIGIPTRVQGLNNIRYIEGGKGYNVAINSSNNVYIIGQNSTGELGNNSVTNLSMYTKLNTIDNIIDISAGNGYTLMLKADGTVWATGDYTQGDVNLKSKTKEIIPIQVGNDETGFTKTEISIPKTTTKDLTEECAFEFNLIKLKENFNDNLTYVSLNEDIATVNDDGVVAGVKIGTTRIKATSTLDNKVYSVLVRVINEEGTVAPQISSGEDFAVVLKSDGNIHSFGYNSDGRLAIGNNLTKDIPQKTNILSTYEKIDTGKNFFTALRSDGTVWTVGNNSNGQLGSGTTVNKSKLTQISGLSDIEKIAAGEDFIIAIDSYGIIYGWGSNRDGQLGPNNIGTDIKRPQIINISSYKMKEVAAGKNQSAFISTKGKVYGYGTILNGEISGIDNAVKVQVGENSILILTANNEVYRYENGVVSQITQLSNVVDISVIGNTEMYQLVDETVYSLGDNLYGELGTGNTTSISTPTLLTNHEDNVFLMSSGYKNTYVIENTGSIYGSGENQYGSLGNGNRNDSLEYTLVGDRVFDITAETAIMKIGDTEELKITGNPFNVFGEKTISPDEYTFASSDQNVATIDNTGKITALAVGTTNITITDKVTNEQITLVRMVIEPEKDRIDFITVNDIKAELDVASTIQTIKYKVQIVTEGNTGTLKIQTKDLNDRISIDNRTTWSYNGTLNQEIQLPNKITQIPIIVSAQNNEGDYVTEVEYILEVEKISDDAQIKIITATSTETDGSTIVKTATPVGLTRYEVVVSEPTTIVSLVDVTTNNQYASISIDGEPYSLNNQNKNIVIGNELTKEVKISVKSEAGTEVEYTLVIYKESELAKLDSLKVNGIEATKISDGNYAVTVEKDITKAEVVATLGNSLSTISINDNDYTNNINAEMVNLDDETTLVIIKVKNSDGSIKTYNLYINKNKDDTEDGLKLDMVIVNGNVILPESDGITYIVHLPNSETTATIRAITENVEDYVQIDNNTKVKNDNEREVTITSNENVYDIVVSDDNGNTKTYKVIIKNADSDASLKKIEVSKGDYTKEATYVGSNTYKVKVPNTFTDVDVAAITGYNQSKVQVANTGNYIINSDTQNVALPQNSNDVSIKVLSLDGSNEIEYTLIIEKISSNADLFSVKVDGIEATLESDGYYHYTLLSSLTSVQVEAIAVSDYANVQINTNSYELKSTTKTVQITAKETKAKIRVKAEDGTVKEYTLILEGLPDDATIATVKVNGDLATYIEGKNRYEIRSNASSFDIDVTLNDLLASMKLGTNSTAIGQDSITVTKQGEETIVEVVVTSQNGLITETYKIAILEKSNNTNIDILKVNNVTIYPNSDGNYVANIKHNETDINLYVKAEDNYSIASIDGTTNNTYTVTKHESVVSGVLVYTYQIEILAENGDTKAYELKVNVLDGDTTLIDVLTSEDNSIFNSATLRADGKYYCKVNRIDSIFVKATTQTSTTGASINGNEKELSESTREVILANEITSIPIRLIAEDGTTQEYTLIIEKKSNDKKVKSVTGTGVISTDIKDEYMMVYVNEDLTSIDLTILLNNANGSLKLESETDYVLSSITRTIDLSSYSVGAGVETIIDIQAEDGTYKQVVMTIYKYSNLKLKSVKVNTDEITYDEDNARYYKLVDNGNTPTVEITTEDSTQIIQLLSSDGSTILATAVGTLSTTVNLSTTSLSDNFIIRVISHNGEDYGSEERNLVIEQKSTEAGIMYVKVDNLGTILDTDTSTYSTSVAGKEAYKVDIKLKNSNAKAKILDSDGNQVIGYQKGELTGSLSIPDGETKIFTIVVQAQNGNEEQYLLSIERISSSTEISSITVTDYQNDATLGTIIAPKNVTTYNKDTKTYKVVVDKNLTSTDIVLTAEKAFTNIQLNTNAESQGTATMTQSLPGIGITEVTINITAADGTEETRYLQIIQLSDEIGISEVQVDGVMLTPDALGNYETTVTDEFNLSEVKVTLLSDKSKVSINGETAEYGTSTVNVEKNGARKILNPIVVTAEDGSTYTYTLTINVISHDFSVKKVTANGDEALLQTESSSPYNGEYLAYIDINATNVEVKVNAGVIYSTVYHEDSTGTILSNIENLTFDIDISDLTQNTFTTTFKIIAEDGTEKEYKLNLVRKSDDASIKNVYVNDIELTPNVGNPSYPDGTYYIGVKENTIGANIEKVKVQANNEFAKVKFDSSSATNVLEKMVTLSSTDKVTQIPVKITSQQGNVYETIIYIEKLSDNNNLDKVLVNSKEPDVTDGNTFTAYIYDTVDVSKIKITSENEYATIVRTTENGETYLGPSGVANKGIGSLEFNIDTIEQITTIYFKIISENGTESSIYTLKIEKMSTDTTLKEIYVNGVLIEPDENGRYETSLLDIDGNPTVKAITNNNLAHVRIALGNEYLSTTQEIVTMSTTNRTTIVPITVRSQSGITNITNLYINRISTSVELDTVTLDGREADNYNKTTHTYTFIIDIDKTQPELFVLADSDYTKLDYEGTEYYASFIDIVDMPLNILGKELKVKVTSEHGEEQEYTIEIIKTSDDTGLEYLKVNNVIVEPDYEGGDTYTVMIPHLATETLFEVKTNYPYANIRLGDNELVRNMDSGSLDCSNLSEERIVVPIVVKAADGKTAKTYNVILVRGSNDTSIELKVNDAVIQENANGNYETGINDTDTSVKIEGTILAASVMGGEAGKIDINSTTVYETPSKTVILDSSAISGKRTITVPIEVIAEDGTKRESVLIITVLSTDASLKSIEINESFDGSNIVRIPTLDTSTNIYETKIKYLTNKVSVVVTANDANAIVEYVDSNGNVLVDNSNNKIKAINTLTTNVDTLTDITYVYYRIVSESGTVSETYTLKIEKMSNNTLIDKIEVNDKVATEEADGNYSMVLSGSTTTGNIVVTPNSSNQKIKIDGVETETTSINLTNVVTTVTISVEAEDGTTVQRILKITKTSSISGEMLTENYETKHKSTITIYRTDDINNPRTVIAQAETGEDGIFEIDTYITGVSSSEDIDSNGIADLLEAEYDIEITKKGYLSYKVTNITLTEGSNVDIGSYNLVAGDVVETGEIEIDDLVALNDNFGVTITGANKDTKSIYDLNEDGIVNKLDRDILKKNYGKLEEVVEWVNPYAISMFSERLTSNFQSPTSNFILPMTCEYVITSEYGQRIHPITGETSFHSGIDIVGEHHTEILAVADGEVTYAGVQSGYGNCVEIKHIVNGETIYSFYAHLSRIDVTVGQTVGQADVIGLEGGASTDPNPGTSTGHHLHFELRSSSGSGHSLNPNNYIEF